MECKICSGASLHLFEAQILNKYNIKYYKCSICGFIQTERPYWLSEAYESAITSLDIGLVYRNLKLSNIIPEIILSNFNYKGVFLDYAGGYGLFVRLMRDAGFNFYWQDLFCENIFARNFEVKEIDTTLKFELATAFEVFEHLENPLEEVRKISNYSDSILFSTELQPNFSPQSVEDWWYFTPETGQHISFFSHNSLKILAENLQLNYYSNGKNLHLFTKKSFQNNPFKLSSGFMSKVKKYVANKLGNNSKFYLDSLLLKDYAYVKEKLYKKK